MSVYFLYLVDLHELGSCSFVKHSSYRCWLSGYMNLMKEVCLYHVYFSFYAGQFDLEHIGRFTVIVHVEYEAGLVSILFAP